MDNLSSGEIGSLFLQFLNIEGQQDAVALGI